ncbi:MAG: T9SS type A sorting domain-containing protein, partial [Ignavibacteria bacterium]|nr:T9SS type A sorting domain-containing protein [Ignavibacteria bacterium]
VIYRFEHPDTVNLNDGRFVRFITPKDTNRYFDAMPIDTNKLSVTFAVTSVDRMNNESEPALYTVVLTGVKDEISVVNDFQLFQNYPNPFNPRTKIRFSIPAVESNSGASPQNVLLKVHDVLGREVATLVNEQKAPGSYEVEFDANSIRGGLTSGVYFYKLSAGGRIKIIKMILQK